ncbi:hypothetical protein [Pseudomonas sp. UV AK001]|uniref:hypothetical protein n=1 Tax=Pseudomonas sp. UV AK001 TaxID=3384791 RepID=UPI0038D3E5E6
MAEKATYAMLRAAMIKAVETNLIPRHSRLAEYIKSWERLELVIQASLDVYPEQKAASGKKKQKPSKTKAGHRTKNR